MRFTEILNEIKMNPKPLQSMTKNLDAKIGIEYEFVYTFSDFAEPELIDEDDYNVYNISSIIEFFKSSEIEPDDSDIFDEVEEYLNQKYNEWIEENQPTISDESFYKKAIEVFNYKIYDDFKKAVENSDLSDDDKRETLRIHNNKYSYDHAMFFEYLTNEEVVNIVKNIKTSSEKESLKKYYKIRKPVYNDFKKFANKLKTEKNMNGEYNEIISKVYPQEKFLRQVYGFNISSVYEKLKPEFEDLYWPQKYEENELTTDKVKEYFDDEVYSKLVGDYDVDSDSSIEVMDESSDIGVEIKNVAPLGLEDTFHDLTVMADFISTNGYTNKSTGLHINVSLPNYSLDNLDYVKLALLLGDEYILNVFDRLGNTYTKPALEEIINRRGDPANILDALQVKLNKTAGKVFFDTYTDKYTSINLHRNRVEFRSPGGDWIEDQPMDTIKETIMRFIVALDAAMDNQKYQKEYAKKLYKWINPDKGHLQDVTKAFALYSVGKIDKQELKNIVAEITYTRPKRGPEYEGLKGDYYAFGTMSYVWGSGTTKEEALKDSYKAVVDYNKENPDNLVSWAAERRNGTFFPIEEHTYKKIKDGHTFALWYDASKQLYSER